MTYAIDVMFLDDGLRVLRIAALKPARALICRAATDSLELRAGECCRLGIAVGDTFARHDAGARAETGEA